MKYKGVDEVIWTDAFRVADIRAYSKIEHPSPNTIIGK
jgi:hypothetical protein